MQPNPNWNYDTFTTDADQAKGVIFELPFQYRHAREIMDVPVWKVLDDAHTMLIGMAVMRAGGKLNPAMVNGANRLLDKVKVIRDEMLVYADAQGTSHGAIATATDQPRATVQKQVEAARKRHGAATQWVTGREPDDLPQAPRNLEYSTVNGVRFGNTWYMFESVPFGTLIRHGDFYILRQDATFLLVGVHGFAKTVTTDDREEIELRSEGDEVAYLVADESGQLSPDIDGITFES
jgi:hypothetical protein